MRRFPWCRICGDFQNESNFSFSQILHLPQTLELPTHAPWLINDDEVKKLLKRYKKIKKYMKSPLYEVKVMDGNEDVVSKLVDEADG